jgi:hypothetical protein
MTATLPKFLRAPRVPTACPVSVIHLHATVSRGGVHRGRHAWIVNDHTGQLVEIISGGDEIESKVWARWPWFGTAERAWFGLGSRQCWPTTLNVTPSELTRAVGWEPWTEHGAKLRAVADRCEQFSAVMHAVRELVREGTGTHPWDGERTATIYHRTVERGGDAVSVAVRDAMLQLVALGMAAHADDPNAIMPDGKTRLGDVVGSYRATETTPNV